MCTMPAHGCATHGTGTLHVPAFGPEVATTLSRSASGRAGAPTWRRAPPGNADAVVDTVGVPRPSPRTAGVHAVLVVDIAVLHLSPCRMRVRPVSYRRPHPGAGALLPRISTDCSDLRP